MECRCTWKADAKGHTKYLSDGMTIQTIKERGCRATTQQPMTSKQASKEEIMPPLRIIHAKLDRLLFETGHESEKHQEESETDGLLIE